MANNELGQTDKIERIERKLKELMELNNKQSEKIDQNSANITELKATVTSGDIFYLCFYLFMLVNTYQHLMFTLKHIM